MNNFLHSIFIVEKLSIGREAVKGKFKTQKKLELEKGQFGEWLGYKCEAR